MARIKKTLPAFGIGVACLWAAASLGQSVPQQAPLGSPPPAVSGVGQWLNVETHPRPWATEGELSFKALAGKVAVLEFWTTWCPSCKRVVPTLNALAKKYRKRGLEVIGLTIPDDRQDATTIAAYASKALRYPVGVLSTGATLRAYNVGKIPYAVVVGRDGRVTWKGNPSVNTKELKTAVLAALKTKATPAPSTPAPSPPAPSTRPTSRPSGSQ